MGLFSKAMGLLRGTASAVAPSSGPTASVPSLPFGYKSAWVAVRSDDPKSVIEAIGDGDCRPIRWGSEVDRAVLSEGAWVVASPPVHGWVLVGGEPLMHWPAIGGPASPLDDEGTLALLKRLSAKFGEAHFYGTYRVTGTHMWSLLREGRLTRLFKFSGDGQYWQYGDVTDPEIGFLEDEDAIFAVDEETVLCICGQWSVDPRSVTVEFENNPDLSLWACRLG